MPWREWSIMEQRAELVALACAPGVNVRRLCERMGVSAPTAYKWLSRFREGGREALADRSRRPHSTPGRVAAEVERMVLEVRQLHPTWGGRKIRARLLALGYEGVPAASTATAVLRRHGLIAAAESAKRGPMTRFERERPNELWQMDFKGHVPLSRGGRCHPLTVLDDHARYCIGLRACTNEREETVRGHLIDLFRRYGMPDRVLCDNGSPWGASGEGEWTALEVWLLERGVGVVHGRARHPQTQGKDERFHRTLKADVLSRVDLLDRAHAQGLFDRWRAVYNLERPHQSLNDQPPVSRYRPSERVYREAAADPGFQTGETLRRVDDGGCVQYRGRYWRIGKAFRGRLVALRATARDGVVRVCLGPHEVGELDPQRGGPTAGRRGRELAALAPDHDEKPVADV